MRSGKTPPPDESTALTGRRDAEPEVIAAYLLRVIAGPDAGATLRLDGCSPGRMLVGTGPACDLRLADPGVSRRHCAFEATARGLRVTDVGSTNGTWCDRTALVDAYLCGGERLRIGTTSLVVEVASAPQAAVLSDAMRFGRVIGASSEMRRLYPLCERLAHSDVPVRRRGRDRDRQGAAGRGDPRGGTAREGSVRGLRLHRRATHPRGVDALRP